MNKGNLKGDGAVDRGGSDRFVFQQRSQRLDLQGFLLGVPGGSAFDLLDLFEQQRQLPSARPVGSGRYLITVTR